MASDYDHDATEAALLDTLSQHLPGMVDCFVAMARWHDVDGNVRWSVLDAPDQDIGTGLGLVKGLDLAFARYFDDQFDLGYTDRNEDED